MGQRVLNYLISMMILLVSPAGSAGSDLIVNCLGDRLPLSLRHEKALSSDLAKNIHPLTPEPGGTSEYSTRIVSEVFSTPERFDRVKAIIEEKWEIKMKETARGGSAQKENKLKAAKAGEEKVQKGQEKLPPHPKNLPAFRQAKGQNEGNGCFLILESYQYNFNTKRWVEKTTLKVIKTE